MRRSSVLQYGLVHSKTWPSLIRMTSLPPENSSWWEFSKKLPVVLSIPQTKLPCPRPRRPCAHRDRTKNRLSSTLSECIDTSRCDLHSVYSWCRIHCSSSCRFHSASASNRVCGIRTSDRVCAMGTCAQVSGTNTSSDYPCARKEDGESPRHRQAIMLRAA